MSIGNLSKLSHLARSGHMYFSQEGVTHKLCFLSFHPTELLSYYSVSNSRLSVLRASFLLRNCNSGSFCLSATICLASACAKIKPLPWICKNTNSARLIAQKQRNVSNFPPPYSFPPPKPFVSHELSITSSWTRDSEYIRPWKAT